jgi:D-alanyl-D-alanine dipeptidase
MINKIRFRIGFFYVIVLFFCPLKYLNCQQINTSRYGVTYIDDKKTFLSTIEKDSLKQMVELKTLIPNINYDLRYASTNNFTGKRLYVKTLKYTYLRWSAAVALSKVQADLNQQGLGLKIFDAYRPYGVTVKFWEMIKDERYVANPSKGSGHNRGLAVDLTIIDLKTGKELDMGTGYDDFTDTAHHVFTQLPANILENRKLLKETML